MTEKKKMGFWFPPQGREIIRVLENGELYVYGKLVAEDIEIYNAFTEFLTAIGYYKSKEG